MSMTPRSRFPFLAVLSVVLAAAAIRPALAGQAAIDEFRRAAYAGDFAAGVTNLETMLRNAPDDTEALFGKGALQVFSAFARIQQGIYDHSTESLPSSRGMPLAPFVGMRSFGGMNAPSLTPGNPDAKPMTYAILRGLISQFAEDLLAAETTLAAVGDRPVKLPVQPLKIAFDLNHDGKIADHERTLASLLAASSWRRRVNPAMLETQITFDTADASWLRGYVNVFLASANLMLAVDFEQSYEAAAHRGFGSQATAFGRFLARQFSEGRPRAQIDAEIEAIDDTIKTLRQKGQTLQPPREQLDELRRQMFALPRTPEGNAERARIQAQIDELNEPSRENNAAILTLNADRRQLVTERDGSSWESVFDLVAFLHTAQWTVIEPQRLRAVRDHLLRVMAQNENTWRLIRAETDDDHEWLPNTRQTPPFGAKPLTDEVIDSWLATTRLSAQVLNGEKLLPHPRFNKGVNLKKLFDEAARIDIVLLITGHDVVPFLEKGEIVDRKTWGTITQPMGREFSTYALWFN